MYFCKETTNFTWSNLQDPKKKKSAKPPLCHSVNSPHKYSKIFLNDCRKAILYSVATRPQPRLAHCTNSAPCKIRLYKFF